METAGSRVLHIVLAEDNPADVTLVQMALRDASLDCVLRIIEDGEQAIAFIETLDADPGAASIDLLLLDMHLPKRDGADILKHLRSTERYAQTPVIVMTSSDSPTDQSRIAEMGASYFRKPSSYKEFLKMGVLLKQLLDDSGAS